MLDRFVTGGMWCGVGLLVLTGVGVLVAYGLSIEVQRINPYDEIRRELTGEIGTEEGAPIRAVVFDRSVLIERPGKVPGIDPAVHYPLQLRTVLYFAAWTVLAGTVTAVAFGTWRRAFLR